MSTETRIKRVLMKLSPSLKEDDFEDGVKLDELFGLDSMTIIDFVAELEKEFNLTIESDGLSYDLLRDLTRLTAYIEKQASNQP